MLFGWFALLLTLLILLEMLARLGLPFTSIQTYYQLPHEPQVPAVAKPSHSRC
jgi:hypothetical protein